MTRITPYSSVHLVREAGVNTTIWNAIPSDEVIGKTKKVLETNGIKVTVTENGDNALSILKNLVPPGAEVMNGSSTTLMEIGYEEFIAGNETGWDLVHTRITAENDSVKRAELRRKSVAAEYFISGVTAISETGEIVGCDASGSRVGAWPFAAGHLILVAGVNKIVPSFDDAMKRVKEYAYPLENARAQKVYGTASIIGKYVILSHERIPGRTHLILVKEALGY
ncbi:MAG: lactate utilization protein [Methanomicrobiales archaeon]